MFSPVLNNPWVRASIALIALIALALSAYMLSPVLVPLFLAFLVAYALDPVVDAMERRMKRTVAVTLLAVIALLIGLSVPLWLLPKLYGQTHDFVATVAARAHGGGDGAEGRFMQWADAALAWTGATKSMAELGWIAPDDANARPTMVLMQKAAEYLHENAGRLAQTYASSVASAGATAGQTIAQIAAIPGRYAVGLLVFLANFALFAFVTGYLLTDFDGIIRALGELVPPRWRATTFSLVGRVDEQLRSFLRGQLAVCACLGAMYAAGLLICRVPFAIPIAAFGAFAGFIPYVGLMLTIIISATLTLVSHGIDWHIVGVLITFGIAQALEGNVLTPRIVGSTVGLHPVWVILAILVFGQTFGLVGMAIAVPAAAVLKVFVEEGVRRYRKSAVFTGAPPAE